MAESAVTPPRRPIGGTPPTVWPLSPAPSAVHEWSTKVVTPGPSFTRLVQPVQASAWTGGAGRRREPPSRELLLEEALAALAASTSESTALRARVESAEAQSVTLQSRVTEADAKAALFLARAEAAEKGCRALESQLRAAHAALDQGRTPSAAELEACRVQAASDAATVARYEQRVLSLQACLKAAEARAARVEAGAEALALEHAQQEVTLSALLAEVAALRAQVAGPRSALDEGDASGGEGDRAPQPLSSHTVVAHAGATAASAASETSEPGGIRPYLAPTDSPLPGPGSPARADADAEPAQGGSSPSPSASAPLPRPTAAATAVLARSHAPSAARHGGHPAAQQQRQALAHARHVPGSSLRSLVQPGAAQPGTGGAESPHGRHRGISLFVRTLAVTSPGSLRQAEG